MNRLNHHHTLTSVRRSLGLAALVALILPLLSTTAAAQPETPDLATLTATAGETIAQDSVVLGQPADTHATLSAKPLPSTAGVINSASGKRVPAPALDGDAGIADADAADSAAQPAKSDWVSDDDIGIDAARDWSGAGTGMSDALDAPAAPDAATTTIIMRETFEGPFPTSLWSSFDDNGWSNGEHYWDDTGYRDEMYQPHGGNWSAWPAAGGANRLDPARYYYPDNARTWMEYGPFDLRGATSARLAFWYWNQSERGYDYFGWYASTNGTNYSGYHVSGDSGGWRHVELDLANVPTIGNLLGRSNVWIAFYFTSDGSVVDDGPFVDDIELRKVTDGACSAPDVSAARARLRGDASMTSPWRQVSAPIQNSAGNRCAAAYQGVIEQFEVTASSFSGRYAAGGSGNSDTRCNIFAGDVMRAMGAPLPTKGELGLGANGYPTSDPMTGTALMLYHWFNGQYRSSNRANEGWRRVDATTAQGLAQLRNHVVAGRPAVAANLGHIAVIRPNQSSVGRWSDLWTAQAGARNFLNDRLGVGFGSSPTPQFYIHD